MGNLWQLVLGRDVHGSTTEPAERGRQLSLKQQLQADLAQGIYTAQRSEIWGALHFTDAREMGW